MDDPTDLPLYTEEGTDIASSIQELIASTEGLNLPITSDPGRIPEYFLSEADGATVVSHNLVVAYFDAIRNKNQDVVAMMIEQNVVTPNTTDVHGMTPLLAAVSDGNIRMVQCLVDFDAETDAFGDYQGSQRTPLQVAAATGHLALVRLLIEVFHADDAILAPNGELALRLAAANGHYDVVDYLPPRRAGGWQRWKVHHAKAIGRAKRAVNSIYHFVRFFVWEIPRFFLWSCPKHLVILPVKRGIKWSWTNRHKFGAWCKYQAQELPRRFKQGAIAVKDWMKKLPKAIAKAAKKIWHFCTVTLPHEVKELFTKRIPAMVKVVLEWLKNGFNAVVNSLTHILQRISSFLHTVLVAIVTFFRSITLKDVWNGFCNALKAVFVDFPVKLWSWIEILPQITLKAMEKLLGDLGHILWLIGWALWRVVTYIPEKLLVILDSFAGSMAKGYQEVLVWVNPKR